VLILGPHTADVKRSLHRHDRYLLQVRAPEESKYLWDYAWLVKTIPAAEAFPLVKQQKCPLVTSR